MYGNLGTLSRQSNFLGCIIISGLLIEFEVKMRELDLLCWCKKAFDKPDELLPMLT